MCPDRVESDRRTGCFCATTFQKQLILTLLFTLLIEGIVATGYSVWRHKPLASILFTSVVGNLITQSFLWIALSLFFRHYLVTLLAAEVLIWIAESILLYCVRANRLGFADSSFLSLIMNLSSFGLGWFLPI
jgi:hypothetical protein